MSEKRKYRGRFAPSPSGPLHMGSLLTALASFLDARANAGIWLLRIEDIDPPREMPCAARLICRSLQAHGLSWDEDVLYQSSRLNAYADVVSLLLERGDAYYCSCSRQSMEQLAGAHAPECPLSAVKPATPAAVRIKPSLARTHFHDVILGQANAVCDVSAGDTVVCRRDGLYAYQLAVVVDDAFQSITHVIRGRDLLDSTAAQLDLQQRLGYAPVQYGHLPLLLNRDNQKLSKQNLATPVDDCQAGQNLLYCLAALGQQAPPGKFQHNVGSLLQWSVDNWRRERIPLHDRVCMQEKDVRPAGRAERNPFTGAPDHVPQ